MTSPILALRRAILETASGDGELISLMGGALRLHDELPRNAEPVYALFGGVAARDWSTGTDRGHEQDLAIVIWSERGSARSGLAVAERFSAILDDAGLSVEGHRLVNLRVTEIASNRDEETQLTRVTLRLRAVTERE